MLSLMEILDALPAGAAIAFVKGKYEYDYRILYSEGERGTAATVSEIELHATKGRAAEFVLEQLKESVKRSRISDE